MRTSWTSLLAMSVLLAACGDPVPSSGRADSGDTSNSGDGAIEVSWDIGRSDGLDGRADVETEGRALLCDGVDDRLLIPIDDLLADPEALTIELWFRPDRYLPVGSRRTYLLSASAGDAFHDELSIGFRDDYDRAHRSIDFKARVAEDGDCNGARGSGWLAELELGQWHHFAATLERRSDGDVVQEIFVDGLSKFGVGTSWPADEDICIEPTVLTLCAGIVFDGTFSAPFVGAIDDVRVSNVVRFRDDFVPEPPTPDEYTVLLLRFDAWPPVDEGAHRLDVEVEGSPRLTTDAP